MANPSSVQLFFEGDDFFDALLRDIGSARRSVLIEFYIFEYEIWGVTLLQKLRQISKFSKVKVRLLVDGIGSRSSLPAISQYVKDSNIELNVFKPVSLFSMFRSGMHRRNHRKIVLIDRRIAYVGGMNVKDEHSQKLVGDIRWRDTMMRIERTEKNHRFFRSLFAGMVFLFQSVLLGVYPLSPAKLWKVKTKSVRSKTVLRRRLSQWYKRAELTQPHLYTTLFRRDRARYRSNYFELLRAAKRRIFLCSPYFIADLRLLRLLRAKAKEGVDVRVLTAGRTDVLTARQAGRSTYGFLLKSGVRIYEMSHRVFHAKQSIIDDSALVGSGNLDYRSFLHNQEVMVHCRDIRTVRSLLVQWGKDVNESDEIEFAIWRRRSLWQKVNEKLCYGFRYYL